MPSLWILAELNAMETRAKEVKEYIDGARKIFPNDNAFQLSLDHAQRDLDHHLNRIMKVKERYVSTN